MGPIASLLHKMPMEFLIVDAEAARVTTNLIECNEPAISVETRILLSFCHHRCSDLLELSSDALLQRMPKSCAVSREKEPRDEINRLIDLRGLNRGFGLLDQRDIFRRSAD